MLKEKSDIIHENNLVCCRHQIQNKCTPLIFKYYLFCHKGFGECGTLFSFHLFSSIATFGINLPFSSRVGRLFLPYTATLHGGGKERLYSKSNLNWSCTISQQPLFVRGLFERSNLDTFASFIFTGIWICGYLLSTSVFLRSIPKLCWAGTLAIIWSVSRWGLRKKAWFSPRIPFSLMSWNTVLISDYLRHHWTTLVSIQHISGFSSSFTRSTGIGLSNRQLSKPQEARMEEMYFLSFDSITVSCFVPLPRFTHLDLSLHHGCLFLITRDR